MRRKKHDGYTLFTAKFFCYSRCCGHGEFSSAGSQCAQPYFNDYRLSGVVYSLSASFLFMVQIIVYAGAILTLFIFIIMFLNVKEANLPKEPNKAMTLFLGSVALLPLNFLILRAFYKMPSHDNPVANDLVKSNPLAWSFSLSGFCHLNSSLFCF